MSTLRLIEIAKTAPVARVEIVDGMVTVSFADGKTVQTLPMAQHRAETIAWVINTQAKHEVQP